MAITAQLAGHGVDPAPAPLLESDHVELSGLLGDVVVERFERPAKLAVEAAADLGEHVDVPAGNAPAEKPGGNLGRPLGGVGAASLSASLAGVAGVVGRVPQPASVLALALAVEVVGPL